MHLREAFWTKIARPIRGHHVPRLAVAGAVRPPGGYRYTHPETQHELARLIREVIRPLGPTLLQVPAAKSDVAFLESFASRDVRPPRHLRLGRRLGRRRLPRPALRPPPAGDRLRRDDRRARAGRLPRAGDARLRRAHRRRWPSGSRPSRPRAGIVVGDERTCPAIKPDIVLRRLYNGPAGPTRTRRPCRPGRPNCEPSSTPATRRYVDSSNPDVIPYLPALRPDATTCSWSTTAASTASTWAARPGDGKRAARRRDDHGAAVRRRSLRPGQQPAGGGTGREDRLGFAAALGPCDGGLYMVCPEPIAAVRVEMPEQVCAGNAGSLYSPRLWTPRTGRWPPSCRWTSKSAIRTDGSAEFSGSYGAANGQVETRFGHRGQRSVRHLADRGPRTGFRPDGQRLFPRRFPDTLASGGRSDSSRTGQAGAAQGIGIASGKAIGSKNRWRVAH